MRKTFLTASIAVTLLGACVSPPQPVMPSGRDRKPINTPAKIEDFKGRTAEEQANYNERSALSRQVESLQEQVQQLKAFIAMQAVNGDSQRSLTGPVTTPLKLKSTATRTAPTRPNAASGPESVEVRDGAVLFRVSHPFGTTAFTPSSDLRTRLIQASRESTAIDVRGRTDARTDNAIDRDIAMQRAALARQFLLDNGVDPKKIRLSFLAAGDHVADNTTPEGRALNRRVEILVKGTTKPPATADLTPADAVQ